MQDDTQVPTREQLEKDLLMACIEAAKLDPSVAPADVVRAGTVAYNYLMAGMFTPE